MSHSHFFFNIANSISGTTIDNGANGKKAVKFTNVVDLSCFCHTLQLAIEDGLEAVQMRDCIAGIRDLVVHIRKSTKACDIIREVAQRRGITKTKVYFFSLLSFLTLFLIR